MRSSMIFGGRQDMPLLWVTVALYFSFLHRLHFTSHADFQVGYLSLLQYRSLMFAIMHRLLFYSPASQNYLAMRQVRHFKKER